MELKCSKLVKSDPEQRKNLNNRDQKRQISLYHYIKQDKTRQKTTKKAKINITTKVIKQCCDGHIEY